MRRKHNFKQIIGIFFAVTLLMAGIPTLRAEAATEQTTDLGVSSYTVTYRPGNVGYFAVAKQDDGNLQQMAQEVANAQYSGYDTETTARGAIKIFLSSGQAIPMAPNASYIQIKGDGGYFAKSSWEWGPKDGSCVTGNTDFVADYGKLVNGVEYTIKYVDSVSGESIAPSVTAKASQGYEWKESAPAVIRLNSAAEYTRISAADKTLVLCADAAKNVMIFEYRLNTPAAIITEGTVFEDGGTVTTSETVTTFRDNEAVQQGEAIQPDGAADGNAVPAQENADDTVQIEDEETPLAQSPSDAAQGEGSSQENVTIEDSEVPLHASIKGSGAVTVAVAAAGLLGIAVIAALIVWLRIKSKRNKQEEMEEAEE